MERQHQGMDMPVIVVVAAHRGRHKSMGDHYSGGVFRSTLTSRLLVSQFFTWKRPEYHDSE